MVKSFTLLGFINKRYKKYFDEWENPDEEEKEDEKSINIYHELFKWKAKFHNAKNDKFKIIVGN